MKKTDSAALDIFAFEDYRKFLVVWIEKNQNRIKGIQTRLAQAAGCNPPFVSHVLSEKNHLSLEQALGMATFLGLNSHESRYFLNLLQYQRAGTKELKDYFRSELEQLRNKKNEIKSRLGLSDKLSPEHEKKYYSHWLYAAVHISLFIPRFENPEILAKSLEISRSRLLEIIHFLEDAGLAQSRGDGNFYGSKPNIHLGKDSDLMQSLHTQWRMRALRDPVSSRPDDIHYSLVLAVAEKDLEKFQELMLKSVDSVHNLMQASTPEEKVFGFNLDFFSIL